jgi:hypothetical protein
MEPSPYIASLRIYEPISSFSDSDQMRWNSIPREFDSISSEQELSLRQVINLSVISERNQNAHVIEDNGKRFVAPWTSTLRFWLGLEEFQSSIHEDSVDSRVPHILTEKWMIPPRWFALFAPEDRHLGEKQGRPFTFLRTNIASAKERCLFAHKAIYKAFGPGHIEEEIRELSSWLNNFHEDSLVECDYGGLAGYLKYSLITSGEPGLDADTSVEDVATALEALSQGDGELAGRRYETFMRRWRRVAALEQAN